MTKPGRNIKNKLWEFSGKTLEAQTTRFISKGGFLINPVVGLSLFSGLYYFADYLLQCGNIDKYELAAIQSKCTELFEKLQSILKEQNVEAFAFTRFPEWG